MRLLVKYHDQLGFLEWADGYRTAIVVTQDGLLTAKLDEIKPIKYVEKPDLKNLEGVLNE